MRLCDANRGRTTHTESMTIQPTSGGVAPLYNPFTPSFRTVCSVQSNGPRNWASLLVCSRTLTVSNLRASRLTSDPSQIKSKSNSPGKEKRSEGRRREVDVRTDDQLRKSKNAPISTSSKQSNHRGKENLPLNFAIPEKTPATKPL
jgi:hypothetical protein